MGSYKIFISCGPLSLNIRRFLLDDDDDDCNILIDYWIEVIQ
jgi:hypothetical protein